MIQSGFRGNHPQCTLRRRVCPPTRFTVGAKRVFNFYKSPRAILFSREKQHRLRSPLVADRTLPNGNQSRKATCLSLVAQTLGSSCGNHVPKLPRTARTRAQHPKKSTAQSVLADVMAVVQLQRRRQRNPMRNCLAHVRIPIFPRPLLLPRPPPLLSTSLCTGTIYITSPCSFPHHFIDTTLPREYVLSSLIAFISTPALAHPHTEAERENEGQIE